MTKAHRRESTRPAPRAAPPAGRATAGQTMIFMIVALVIAAVVIVWIFDVHTVLHLKARTQNAGDAAALAAARWQGITLNLIGDLNILQALALSGGDADAAARIAAVQARLCFVGPLVGLYASQQAAKNNRAYSNPDYTANLAAHAEVVWSHYAADTNNFPPPFENAWDAYSAMLSGIASDGIAAGPDNTSYFLAPVTEPPRGFYEAVASRDWCWFYWNDLAILHSYSSYLDWPAPPARPPPNTHNSEVFGLGLIPFRTVLPGGAGALESMNQLRSERGISPDTISNEVAGIVNTWYRYDGGTVWTNWSMLAPANDFPILPLQVKPEYDYVGADAIVRIEAQPDARMPAAFPAIRPFLSKAAPAPAARLTDTVAAVGAVTWTAAAKPFGYLSVDGGRMRPDYYGLVLPAFHDVRLIPVDAASGANIGAYDLNWYSHIRDHMPTYLQSGLAGLEAGCWYCQQLQTWEDPAFRQEGIDWLSDTNNSCDRFVSGGSRPGGGTRRGH